MMILKSPAFRNGGKIPIEYTDDGDNVSPDLMWKDIPQTTRSLALICDDPDAPAGNGVHWIMYDIPPRVHSLHKNIPPAKRLVLGIKQGINDFHKSGYGGPAPPTGNHRYYFKLYALDKKIKSDIPLTKRELLKKIDGHVLAEAKLMGRYSRK